MITYYDKLIYTSITKIALEIPAVKTFMEHNIPH